MSSGTPVAVGRRALRRRVEEVLSENVIAIRAREENSRCRPCATPLSRATPDFESYIALDQLLYSQRDPRERRSGFEGIVGSGTALGEVLDQVDFYTGLDLPKILNQ